jgi:plastocyanin
LIARTGVVAAMFGLLLSVTGSAAPSAAAAAKPVTHTVTIDGTRFQPESLAVKPGDTVVWVNKDPFPHTVTSKDGGFDSREIQPGASWKYKARTKGEFTYICTLHPTMKGTLRTR